ncbi:hypothetical protein APUTEX25_003837, partial [Auxenochlorella protothecoides]
RIQINLNFGMTSWDQQGNYSNGSGAGQGSRGSGYVPPHMRGAGGARCPVDTGLPAPEALDMRSYLFAGENTGINFDAYEDIPVEATGSNVPEPISTFQDIDMGKELMENVRRCKYTKPTPVQRYSIPIGMAGRDLMACAQTGSGKTAAFCFPIIAHALHGGFQPGARGRKAFPLALVLSPTRELSSQIYDEARKFCYQTGVRPVVVYGGAPQVQQLRELERGCDFLVATPGRLIDIMDRGRVSLAKIRYLALDEADRMLDMGFEPQIRRIVQGEDMPPVGRRQTLLFSATFPKEIQRLAADFLHDYVFLAVGRVGSSTELIVQHIEFVPGHEKRQMVLDLVQSLAEGLTLVRSARPRCASFRSGRTPVLVATDVAARGLDIPHVTHVINFDLPADVDDYVHRIGRTGRAGKKGLATAFFSDKDAGMAGKLVELLQETNQEDPPDLPKARDASGKQGDWFQMLLARFNPISEKASNTAVLDFEKPLVELDHKIREVRKVAEQNGVDVSSQIKELEARARQLRKETYAKLTPIQRLQVARHPNRPTFLDIALNITDKFVELHGDRMGLDDPALVCGIASMDETSFMFIGHQKGRNTKENIYRNFGMPQPNGYRKALRFMRMADKFGFPIITFVDTPGAYAGLKAEELGQGEAIAMNLREMFNFRVPIISIVIGEGGSGGALAIGCANRMLIMENAVYYVASPEACAAILWKSRDKAGVATEALKITPRDLVGLGVMDEIVPEPLGAAHTDPMGAFPAVREAVLRHYRDYVGRSATEIMADRYMKFRHIGVYEEFLVAGGDVEAARAQREEAPGAYTKAGTWAPTEADARYIEKCADADEKWEQSLIGKEQWLNPPKVDHPGWLKPGWTEFVLALEEALEEEEAEAEEGEAGEGAGFEDDSDEEGHDATLSNGARNLAEADAA